MAKGRLSKSKSRICLVNTAYYPNWKNAVYEHGGRISQRPGLLPSLTIQKRQAGRLSDVYGKAVRGNAMKGKDGTVAHVARSATMHVLARRLWKHPVKTSWSLLIGGGRPTEMSVVAKGSVKMSVPIITRKLSGVDTKGELD
ncbi:hypothetical protein E5D57_009354 [Metarhizium anisopliae]|nr:hypothetical protein E5D57_009354 [Metarhizium anisopliae]